MTERTLRISARMAEEIQQWASDELSQWPRDTAYAADLESLLAQIAAAQPATVDVKETPAHDLQAGLTLTDNTQAPQADPVAEVAKPSLCDGCGQPTESTCWVDRGMSLCGFPLCGNCQHVDERFGWSHKPIAKGSRT